MITGLENIAQDVNSSALDTSPTNPSNELGKNDFLRLLVAQLSAQDPLNPMDAQDFSAQLAQFSSLEQMTNVNTNLEQLITAQKSVSNASMVNLIGKQVDIKGNHFEYTTGQNLNLNYNLEDNAQSVLIDIYDANGRLVNTLEGNNRIGSHLIPFNGRDFNGNLLTPGTYSFTLRATDTSGNTVGATTFTTGGVTDVLFDNNEAFAIVNGEKIPAGEITRVSIKS